MAISTDEIYSTLNDLIQTSKDGEEGFRAAADAIKDPEIRNIFLEYARQRTAFAAELQAKVAQLGGKPEKSGSVSGALHRGWMGIKTAVSGKDEGAIIAEAERGEDAAVEAYRKALEKDLPRDIREIIEKQYQQILEAHNRIRSLELKMKSGTTHPQNT
jgi:uncharacterized protein (TIGR02284 family)